jgi:hypothetical protein
MSQDEHEKEGLSQKDENIQSQLVLLNKPVMHELIIESSKIATKSFEQSNNVEEGGNTNNLLLMKKSTDVFIKRSTINFTVNDLHSDITKIMIDEIPDKKTGSLNEGSLNTSIDG